MISLREADVLTETGNSQVQRVRMRLPCSDGATLNKIKLSLFMACAQELFIQTSC